MWIVNGNAHSQFNIPHSWCQQSPANFFIKALSSELGAFMMRIVDSRFAATSWTRIWDCLNTFMMWIVKQDVGVFSDIRLRNEKFKCRPTGNKENFFIMYFGYLLQPPPPLCELARPAEWGFVYMVITGYKIKSVLLYYEVTILINSVTRK